LALLVLALYSPLPLSPYRVYVLRTLFSQEDPAFFGFYLLAFLGLLLLIGPAVVLSGASLPLLFHHLRRQVEGLGDIAGKLYSWNTVGSLLGALLAGYALLFWLDLHHVFRIAVAALIVAAMLVTVQIYQLPRVVALAAIPLVAWLGALDPWDPRRFAIPVVSIGNVLPHTYDGIDSFLQANPAVSGIPLLFHEDDPTSTTTVWEYPAISAEHARSLSSDGRSDGSTFGPDTQSLRLLALLPAMMAEKAERGFVVGFGLGITAGELGRIDTMQEVTAVEISPGVVKAAEFFEHANLGPLANPVVSIVRSDAYRALMRSSGTFDVIVSQPSHLWVTGAEMVLSREFLEAARGRLAPGGVFGQWIPETGIDGATIELLLRTFLSVFEEVSLWETQSAELILLGFKDVSAATDPFRLIERAGSATFSPGLKRAGVANASALLAHERVPAGVLRSAALDGPLHTLLHPRLNYLAARALFRRDIGSLPFTGYGEAASNGAANSLVRRWARTFRDGLPDRERGELVDEACHTRIESCFTLLAAWQSEAPESSALAEALERNAATLAVEPPETVAELSELFLGGRPGQGAWLRLDEARDRSQKYVRFHCHAAPFDGQALLDVWSRCRVGLRSPGLCREQATLDRQRNPTMDEAEFERLVELCSETPIGGAECQAGLNEARDLLDRGVVPEAARG
jgi:spermidine synthase